MQGAEPFILMAVVISGAGIARLFAGLQPGFEQRVGILVFDGGQRATGAAQRLVTLFPVFRLDEIGQDI